MIAFQLFEFFISFIEGIIGVSINAKVLVGKETNYKGNVLAAFFIAISIWLVNQYQIFSFTATIIATIGISIASRKIYKTKFLDSIVLTTLYVLMVYVVDFFSISVLAFLFNKGQFANTVISSFSVARIYYLLLDKAILVCIYFVFVKHFYLRVKISIFKTYVGIVLASVMIIILIKTTLVQVDAKTFLIWLLLLLLVLLALYSSIQYMSYLKEKNWLTMAAVRNRLLVDNYEKEIQSYNKNQIFYHDLKNQYIIILNYLKNKEYNQVEAYIDKLGIDSKSVVNSKTGIRTLDILTECKMQEAETKGISVDVDVDHIELKLNSNEIVALIGNLLDNAIEACERMENGNKRIKIVVRKVNEMVCIKVSNSCKEPPNLLSGRFITLKNNKNTHGLGMASMRLIVDKYDGVISNCYDKGTFVVTISFFN